MEQVDEHTLLLLHGDSFEDASGNNLPVTNKGVKIHIFPGNFGGGSLYFGGNSMLTVFSEAFKSFIMNGNMTIDWWEYRKNVQGISVMLNRLDNPGYSSAYLRYSGSGIYSSYSGSSWSAINSGNALAAYTPLNAWYHNAFVKSGNNVAFYFNGKKVFSTSVQNTYSGGDGNCYIGGLVHNEYFYLDGYIQEFRISDVARWTSDFTPPTEPYTARPKLIVQMKKTPSKENPVFAKVFTVNQKKRINTRADLPMKYFPDIPLERPTPLRGEYDKTSKIITAPFILDYSPLLDKQQPMFVSLSSENNKCKNYTSFVVQSNGAIKDITSVDTALDDHEFYFIGEPECSIQQTKQFDYEGSIELKLVKHEATSSPDRPLVPSPSKEGIYELTLYPMVNGSPQKEYAITYNLEKFYNWKDILA